MYKAFILLIFLTPLFITGYSQVKPSKVFGDHMVLQRHQEVPVWGTASPGEIVKISIHGIDVEGKTNKNGEWKVSLPPFKAGGPYELMVSGQRDTVVFKNVMFGEVWFASGQSNMMYHMERGVPNGEAEIATANYENIRLFHHPKTMQQHPVKTIGGGNWQTCTPENIRSFSAVAYYFARELHQHYEVPVGVILSGWGGTRAEAWCSYDVLKSIDEYREEAIKLESGEKDWISEYEPTPVRKERNKQIISKSFEGIKKGVLEKNYDDTQWKEDNLNPWAITTTNVIWLRKEFILEKNDNTRSVIVKLGKPHTRAHVYMNGVLVYKSIGKELTFSLPSTSLHTGRNTITLRLGDGGLKPRLDLDVAAQISTDKGEALADLTGNWKYSDQLEPQVKPYVKYSHINGSLFGGMVHPFVGYGIKGVIWYQGEANSTSPYLYREVFPKMINDWRAKWGQGDFPFLYVQLPNYNDPKAKKGQFSSWPVLRESQMKTLDVPNTGMAIAIDLGDSTDIHPRNKYPVGLRLSKIARHLVYGEDIVYTGPMQKHVTLKGAEGFVQFNHVGSGLATKDGLPLIGFEIAGPDQKFHVAKAVLKGDEVVVSSDKVKEAKAVRYNWDDNPSGNLYNKEGFAAAPFRTDAWRDSDQQ